MNEMFRATERARSVDDIFYLLSQNGIFWEEIKHGFLFSYVNQLAFAIFR